MDANTCSSLQIIFHHIFATDAITATATAVAIVIVIVVVVVVVEIMLLVVQTSRRSEKQMFNDC